MSKKQFDLSNPGGQPKDWAQRQQDREIEGGLGFKATMLLLILAASALVTGYGLLKFLFWAIGKS